MEYGMDARGGRQIEMVSNLADPQHQERTIVTAGKLLRTPLHN